MRALVRGKGAVEGSLNNAPLLIGHGLHGRCTLEEEEGLDSIPLLLGHRLQLCLGPGSNRHLGDIPAPTRKTPPNFTLLA